MIMLIDFFPNDFKIVRDSVHGYIRIPTCYMKEIVDTELFQRLRHVEQTSMRPLFPSSRHDRFIHSLGVYHLGCRAFESLHRNAVFDGACDGLEGCEEAWWLKHYALFTLACLLHDCAHAAFSHTYENYYTLPRQRIDDNEGEPTSISRLDAEMCEEYKADECFESDFLGLGGSGTGAPHERMSALMVRRYFRTGIERIFTCLNELQESSGRPRLELVDADLAFMARMIVGCQYKGSSSPTQELRNCFISLLNSQTVDVDGLDYMIRDTYNSGITNRSVDCDRLLDSLRLREAIRFNKTSIDDESIEGVWLPNATIRLNKEHQEEAAASFLGDLNCEFSDRDDCKNFLRNKGITAQGSQLTYATGGDLERTTLSEMRSGCVIHVNKLCRARLRHWTGELDGVLCASSSQLKSIRRQSSHITCTATYVLAYGKSSLSVLQSAVDARNTFYQWVYTHPQVVYHSNFLQNYLLKMAAKYLCCLQRIEDVEARQSSDALMLKLEPEMPPRHCSRDCPLCEKKESEGEVGRKGSQLVNGGDPGAMQPVGEEDAIARILGIDGFFKAQVEDAESVVTWLGHQFCRSSDDDLNALFKWVYLHNKRRGESRNKDIEEYFGEYFSRPHHHAIWKSFGELELFKRKHSNVPVPAFSDLRGARQSMSSTSYVFIDRDTDLLSSLASDSQHDLIAIEAMAKLKSLDYAGILVAYGEDTERLVDVLDSSTSFTSPEPLMFIFEVKD